MLSKVFNRLGCSRSSLRSVERRTGNPRLVVNLNVCKGLASTGNVLEFAKDTRFGKRWYSEVQIDEDSVPLYEEDFEELETAKAIQLINAQYGDISEPTKVELESLMAFSRVMVKRAVDKNDVDAQVLLGIVFSQDADSTKESLSWFLKAAEAKNSFAEYAVGIIYLTGKTDDIMNDGQSDESPAYYIDTDNLRAFLGDDIGVNPTAGDTTQFSFRKWLKAERKRIQAAKQKSAESSEADSEKCLEVDTEKGIEYLTRSAEQGLLDAIMSLGILYMSPSHFNLELGHKWLEIAANEHNDTAAMYHIGMYYWNLEEDGAREKAVEWFEKGASKGSTPAMFWLGYAHHQGEAPFTQNTQKACEYLEKGVTFNDPECLHYYGIMLRGGEQIPKDAERGFKYLVRAAEHPDTPHADAAYIVGMVYLRGDESAAVDYRKAMHFMKIAGREGHPEALNTLGAMYYSGLGTEQDYEKAFYSYQNAALYDYQPGIENLIDMYEKGLGVPKNEESAAYFKSRLAELRKEQPAGHSNDKLLDILNNASQKADGKPQGEDDKQSVEGKPN